MHGTISVVDRVDPGHAPRIDGAIFGAGFVAYLVARQALLRVRAERREVLWRRTAARAVPGGL